MDVGGGVFGVEEGDILDSLRKAAVSKSGMMRTRKRTILPRVSVPVLSEQSTDMQPRVSIVARFLTRTLRFAILRATMVKDSATQTGRPCIDMHRETLTNEGYKRPLLT